MKLKEALKIGKLSESYILAGEKGLENEVTSITIMDIAQISEWLKGGELLISGILFAQCASIDFIKKLVRRKVPAVITKAKFANKVPYNVYEYCNSINFPVIIAPEDCNWGEIMNPVINSIISKPYKILEETYNYHETLIKSMIEGISISTLCDNLYESSGLVLAVADKDYYLLGYSKNIDWKGYTRDMSKYTVQYSGLSYNSIDNDKSYILKYSNILLQTSCLEILIYPVSFNNMNYGNILIAISTKEKPPSNEDIMKIQQFGLIVALNSTKQNEIYAATKNLNNVILDKLVENTNYSYEKAEAILATTGKKVHRNYYMVQFKYRKNYNIDSIISQTNRMNRLYDTLERYIEKYEHIIIFERSDSHFIMLPDSIANLESLIGSLKEKFTKALEVSNIIIGISDVVPLNNLRLGYKQAQYASNYLLNSKTNAPFLYYKDLGVLKYFFNNKGDLNEEFLNELYERYITPLINHDELYHTELLKTLELYIQNNFSKVKTEKDLFIHKNTLRARLSSINKVLNCDVDSSEDIFNIQLCLKYKYFKGA